MQAGGQGRRCQKGMAGGAKFPEMHPKARRKREQGKKNPCEHATMNHSKTGCMQQPAQALNPHSKGPSQHGHAPPTDQEHPSSTHPAPIQEHRHPGAPIQEHRPGLPVCASLCLIFFFSWARAVTQAGDGQCHQISRPCRSRPAADRAANRQHKQKLGRIGGRRRQTNA